MSATEGRKNYGFSKFPKVEKRRSGRRAEGGSQIPGPDLFYGDTEKWKNAVFPNFREEAAGARPKNRR